nr:hypothetical protein [uncultured Flavobacterium sp.]
MTLLIILRVFTALVAIIMFACTLSFAHSWRTSEVLQEKYHCQAMALLCAVITIVFVLVCGLLFLFIPWAPL